MKNICFSLSKQTRKKNSYLALRWAAKYVDIEGNLKAKKKFPFSIASSLLSRVIPLVADPQLHKYANIVRNLVGASK